MASLTFTHWLFISYYSLYLCLYQNVSEYNFTKCSKIYEIWQIPGKREPLHFKGMLRLKKQLCNVISDYFSHNLFISPRPACFLFLFSFSLSWLKIHISTTTCLKRWINDDNIVETKERQINNLFNIFI